MPGCWAQRWWLVFDQLLVRGISDNFVNRSSHEPRQLIPNLQLALLHLTSHSNLTCCYGIKQALYSKVITVAQILSKLKRSKYFFASGSLNQ